MTPARRVDLVGLGVPHSYTSFRGGPSEYVTYLLGVAASVTRDGLVRAVRLHRGHVTVLERLGARCGVMPAGALAAPAADVVEACAAFPEPSTLEELQALVRPWMGLCKVEPWPEGRGWHVGGHEVMRLPSGEALVRFVGTPNSGRTRVLPLGPAPSDDDLRALVRASYLTPTSSQLAPSIEERAASCRS